MEAAGRVDELVFLTRVSGTHLPGTPELSGPFPSASLWDGRCCVLYPHVSQDSRCGPRVVVRVVGDVPFGVGGLAVH